MSDALSERDIRIIEAMATPADYQDGPWVFRTDKIRALARETLALRARLADAEAYGTKTYQLLVRAIEQRNAATAEASRLRAACEKGGLHSEDLPTQLEWVAGRLVFRYGDDDKRDYIIALKDRAAALRAALRPAAAPGGQP